MPGVVIIAHTEELGDQRRNKSCWDWVCASESCLETQLNVCVCVWIPEEDREEGQPGPIIHNAGEKREALFNAVSLD